MSNLKEEIERLVDGFVSGINDENKKLYRQFTEDTKINLKFDDYESFYITVIYPFENLIDGFLRSEVTQNEHAIFLITNSQFVERHFKKTIIRKEGSPCSVDKARAIMSGLIKFYLTGEPIQFKYEGKRPYWLPEKVFKTHDDIVNFYLSVKALFYGNFDKYLAELKNIAEADEHAVEVTDEHRDQW